MDHHGQKEANINTAQIWYEQWAGTNNAQLFGGLVNPTSYADLTETWNGTSWTETADLNTIRRTAYGRK